MGSNQLPKSKLSEFIEERVNSFLETQATESNVNIRVLSNQKNRSEIKPGMRRKFLESGCELSYFPYIAKTIYAFQELNGVDLCFFGLHVQEYGTDCSEPNARRINIAYLDTIKLFDPAILRSEIYRRIILAYLDYAKTLGYAFAHIWVSPPSDGCEYIFYSHPPGQKTLSHDLLLGWYTDMLKCGLNEGIIESFSNLYKSIQKSSFSITKNIPYFDGDFWPHIIEQNIEKEKAIVKKGKKSQDLNAKILSIVEKMQQSFIIINLQSKQGAAEIDVSFSKFGFRFCLFFY